MAEVGLLPFARVALQSLPGSSPAVPKPIQQTPMHTAAVAGDPLPGAPRGLDLSRS
jgi:hypothetical protein